MVNSNAYGDGFTGTENTAEPSAVYIKGSEFVDGSLRLIPSERGQSGNFDIEVRQRTNGVWNSTGVKVGGATVRIADELEISGAGEWIRTKETFSGASTVVPNVEFDDVTGTGLARSPQIDSIIIRALSQPDNTSEVVGTFLQTNVTAQGSSLASKIYLQVGSVAATSPVNLKLRRSSPTGEILFEQELPVSLMAVAGSEFTVDLLGMIEINAGETFFGQAESETSFSLKSNASGFWFLAADAHPFGREEIILENLALSKDADLIFANDGGFVVTKFFGGLSAVQTEL